MAGPSGLPQRTDKPILINRLLADAPEKLKVPIRKGIASGKLTGGIIMRRENLSNANVVGMEMADGSTAVFATALFEGDKFSYFDKLRRLTGTVDTILAISRKHTEALLEEIVDTKALARAGLLITDHKTGTDFEVDALFSPLGAIATVEGLLVIDSNNTIEGVEHINELHIVNGATVNLPDLARVNNLSIEEGSHLIAKHLDSVDTLRVGNGVKFGHSRFSVGSPFAFETDPSSDRYEVVALAARTAPSPYVHFAGLPYGLPTSVTDEADLYIYDNQRGTVTPLKVFLFEESEVGDVARFASQQLVWKIPASAELRTSLRNDSFGKSIRELFKQEIDYPSERAGVHAYWRKVLFELKADMATAEIEARIELQPLSLAYSCNDPSVCLNPKFIRFGETVNPNLVEHIKAVHGGVRGIAIEGDHCKVLVDGEGGKVLEGLARHDLIKELRGDGPVTVADKLEDLVAHPVGTTLSPADMVRYLKYNSTLLHVALTPEMAAQGVKFENLLPEYNYLLDTPDAFGVTPFALASKKGNIAAMEAMLENGVTLPSNGAGVTEMYRYALSSEGLDAVQLLTKHLRPNDDALMVVAEADIEAATCLIGAYPNLANLGTTYKAVLAKNEALLGAILKHLPDHAKPLIDEPIITAAIDSGKKDMALALIKASTANSRDANFFISLVSQHARHVNPQILDALVSRASERNRDRDIDRFER